MPTITGTNRDVDAVDAARFQAGVTNPESYGLIERSLVGSFVAQDQAVWRMGSLALYSAADPAEVDSKFVSFRSL